MAQTITELPEEELQRLIHGLQQQIESGIFAEVTELRAASVAKDQMLAVLSHELRTPLQPVLSAASALLRDPRLPPDLLDDIRTIQRNVQLEARLIDDLLDITRITSGKLSLEKLNVNLDSVIARAVEICEPDVIAKKQTLTLKLRAERTWVHGDPGRLQQILWNLIKNAVKFTPVGGSVEISSRNDADGRLIVEVMDTGIGIEPDALTRIFNAFEQASDSVTKQFGGLGLGLAICKVLAEGHGGTLTADSKGPGRGAAFKLTLPSIDQPVNAASKVADYKPTPVRKLRILLVEDDADTCKMMTVLLQSIGHTVTVRHDYASSVRAADDGEFDLLLSDLGLPDGSGLNLMARVKPRGVKGIALTGYGAEADIQASLDAGFDCHLTKPVTLDQVVQAMRRIFDPA